MSHRVAQRAANERNVEPEGRRAGPRRARVRVHEGRLRPAREGAAQFLRASSRRIRPPPRRATTRSRATAHRLGRDRADRRACLTELGGRPHRWRRRARLPGRRARLRSVGCDRSTQVPWLSPCAPQRQRASFRAFAHALSHRTLRVIFAIVCCRFVVINPQFCVRWSRVHFAGSAATRSAPDARRGTPRGRDRRTNASSRGRPSHGQAGRGSSPQWRMGARSGASDWYMAVNWKSSIT